MDIVAQHFETKSDAHLRACYIAQSVIGLGRVNWLHYWCMRTSASNSAVCNSVAPLPYPDVTWFSAVLGVRPELLLFVDSGATPPWSSFFSVIFGGVLCAAIILAVLCTHSTIYVPQTHVHRRTRSRFLFMMPGITSPSNILDHNLLHLQVEARGSTLPVVLECVYVVRYTTGCESPCS